MRITLAQLRASTDVGANIEALRDAAREAAKRGSDLLVLPEYASAFDPRGTGIEVAQEEDGSYVAALRQAARASGVAIVAGVVLSGGAADSDGGPARARNVVIGVSGTGDELVRYDKVHLYNAFGAREADRLAPGDPAAPAAVFDLAGMRVGVMTCYDLRFPEQARRLVDAGAEVVVVPAAWAAGAGKVDQWRILAQARAIENVSVVVGVGQCGPGVIGHSLVVNVDGAVGPSLGTEPGFVTADIDKRMVASARDVNPSLANRRYRVVPGAPAVGA